MILNQFSEFGNYLGHCRCTGPALGARVRRSLRARPDARLAAFVSASGSAGTLGAGDYLKTQHGTRIAAVEALECPTMLYNGFGEHNIQGIGDKHIPLIHNVMNTDVVVAVSRPRQRPAVRALQHRAGRAYLRRSRACEEVLVAVLPHFGLSSICNIVAAIKTAKTLDLGADDVIYRRHRRRRALRRAAPTCGARRKRQARRGSARPTLRPASRRRDTEHVLEADHARAPRIFNLGYFTWVEQQGYRSRTSSGASQASGAACTTRAAWDELIAAFNRDSGNAWARTRRNRMSGADVRRYDELRSRTRARDRSLREKVMSLEEAASLVNDGDHVALGGCTMSRTPMAMIWALVRAGAEEPHLLALASSPAKAICCSPPARRTTS